jgi:hypothetical protein
VRQIGESRIHSQRQMVLLLDLTSCYLSKNVLTRNSVPVRFVGESRIHGQWQVVVLLDSVTGCYVYKGI